MQAVVSTLNMVNIIPVFVYPILNEDIPCCISLYKLPRCPGLLLLHLFLYLI
jgi:hypothetical protein